MCAYNVHSVNIVKLLTLTLSWIIITVSFNDTGLTVLVVNCRPTRLYVMGIMEKGSVTSTGSLRKLPRNPWKVAKFWFSFGVKTRSFSASGGLAPWPPDQGLCPWTPLGTPPPDPHYSLALPRSPSGPLCLIPRSALPSITEWEVHITAQGPRLPKWPILVVVVVVVVVLYSPNNRQ